MIKLFLCDLDGTLTDGGYCVSSLPDMPVDYYSRQFNTRDFVGIKLLHDAGIRVAVLTGAKESSPNQFKRAAPYMGVFAGVRDKHEFVKSTFIDTTSAGNLAPHPNLSWDEIAFIGDEINDYTLLKYVGVAGCPADSSDEVLELIRDRSDGYVMSRVGGHACVREFTDIICDLMNIPIKWNS